MTHKTIAIFYQSTTPPTINGSKKPLKPGGYSDSGADIAFALKTAGKNILTPVPNPNPQNPLDWVFPDTDMGLRQAFLDGANVFWMNTVLFAGHPIDRIRSNDLSLVGQDAEKTQTYDDKFYTNTHLREEGLTVARSILVDQHTTDLPPAFTYPIILKPIRGRGSVGVTYIPSKTALSAHITAWTTSDAYGSSYMAEEFLPGEEITITVMPPGTYKIQGQEVIKTTSWALPAIKRFNQIDHVAPYNGTVAVVHNSKVLSEEEGRDPEILRITSACEKAADLIEIKAPIRIDCRRDAQNAFKIFDVNLKPNLTGAGRPGRDDQDSLTTLAAHAIGWTYAELLENILNNAWPSR